MQNKAAEDRYIVDKFVSDCNVLIDENHNNEITGVINTPQGVSLKCDFNVIVVLKVLLTTGTTYNDQLAEACRCMFKEILCADREFVTCKKALSAITANSYEASQLHRAVKAVLGV